MKNPTKSLVVSAVILLFATSFDFKKPADSKEAILADWERAKAYTLEYIDAMPEDGINYKPTKEVRSFAEQMLHIAGSNTGIMGIALGTANVFSGNIEKEDQYKNKKALKDVVIKSYDHCIQAIKDFDMSKADELVKGFGGAELSRSEWLKKNFEHQTHHRGQTTIYLRMKGIKPPPEKLL